MWSISIPVVLARLPNVKIKLQWRDTIELREKMRDVTVIQRMIAARPRHYIQYARPSPAEQNSFVEPISNRNFNVMQRRRGFHTLK